MNSQFFNNSNGRLPTTGFPTSQALGGEYGLVPEEGFDGQASSSFDQHQGWVNSNGEVTQFCEGTTGAQYAQHWGSSDWSPLAAPRREVDFPPSAAPLNFGGDNPILSDLNAVNTGPSAWMVAGSDSGAAYGIAEPSSPQTVHPALVGPGPFSFFGCCAPEVSSSSGHAQQLMHRSGIPIRPGPSTFDPGPSSTFGSELSTYFNQDPLLDYSSPIRDMNLVFSSSPGPLELVPFDPALSSIFVSYTTVTRETAKPFYCVPCKRGFDRLELLVRHKGTQTHARNLAAEGIPLDQPPRPAASCPLCESAFTRHDNLRPHMLRHMGYANHQTRTMKISVEDSIRMGYGDIDPRCAP